MNKLNSVMYVGYTSNLCKRIYDHKNKVIKSFTSRYNITKLVYYEVYDDMQTAKHRERQIKNWKRIWKLELIMNQNPTLKDLSNHL